MKQTFLIPVFLFFAVTLFCQTETVSPKKIYSSVKTDIGYNVLANRYKIDIRTFKISEENFIDVDYGNVEETFTYQKTTEENGISKQFYLWNYFDGTAILIYNKSNRKISIWYGYLIDNGNKQFFHYSW